MIMNIGDERETDYAVENLSCVEIDKFLEEVSQRAVEACGDVERAVPLHVPSSEQRPVLSVIAILAMNAILFMERYCKLSLCLRSSSS